MAGQAPGTIDEYRIVRELGCGATSVVYLARDPGRDCQVALKRFHAAALADPEKGPLLRRLLDNEAALAGRMVHPHIVRIYDAALAPEKSYIVMEYVPGTTLEAHALPATLLPVARVVEIARKCALALEYATRNGVIHRDIKPANIMLRDDGEVKIADFGAALLTQCDQTRWPDGAMPLIGLPDAARHEALSQQTDIYSFGVVMFRLLTGRMPFNAESSPALTRKIVEDEPPPLRSVRPELPLRLEAIVARALAKSSARRYADWREFADDLARLPIAERTSR